jgi:hypothetical protein
MVVFVSLAVFLLAPGAELVATAPAGAQYVQPGARAPVPATSPASPVRTTAEQIEAWIGRAGPVEARPEGVTLSGDAPPERWIDQVHGEVGAAVGTGGYRSWHAYVEAPIGENGRVAFGVEQTRRDGLWRLYE